MGKDSRISWTTNTWNPVTGCSKVSPGCEHCYAETLAEKYRGLPNFPNGFDLTLRPHKINEPVKWKTPSYIFVNSLSDLFHKGIPEQFLMDCWETMVNRAPWHIYQILTKRPHVAVEKISRLRLPLPPHIWLGVSTETQQLADNRIFALAQLKPELQTLFISAEPLLETVNFRHWLGLFGGYYRHDGPHDDCNHEWYCPSIPGRWCICGHARSQHEVESGWCAAAGDDCYYFTEQQPTRVIDWFIDGGESGKDRRPVAYDAFRRNRDDCLEAGVPYYHKQGNHFRPDQDKELDGQLWRQKPDLLPGSNLLTTALS